MNETSSRELHNENVLDSWFPGSSRTYTQADTDTSGFGVGGVLALASSHHTY